MEKNTISASGSGNSSSVPRTDSTSYVDVPRTVLPNNGPNVKPEKALQPFSFAPPRSRPASSSGLLQTGFQNQGQVTDRRAPTFHFPKPTPITKRSLRQPLPLQPQQSHITTYDRLSTFELPRTENATDSPPSRNDILEEIIPQEDTEPVVHQFDGDQQPAVPQITSEVTIKEEEDPDFVRVINFHEPDIIVIPDDDGSSFQKSSHRVKKQQHRLPPARIPQTSSSFHSVPGDPNTSTTSARGAQADTSETDNFGHVEIARLSSPVPRLSTHRQSEPQFLHPGMHRRSLTEDDVDDEIHDDRYREQLFQAGHLKEARQERDFEDYPRPMSKNLHRPLQSAREFARNTTRGRLPTASPWVPPGTPTTNDIDIVQGILNDKFRRAQVMEDELAKMQSVVLDIDEKLGSIFEKEQELSSLRDRCKRFQDSLNDGRDKQLAMKDEIDRLRFQVHTAHDELQRNQIETEHRLSRAAIKQEQSDDFIKRLKSINNATKEEMSELRDEHRRILNECSDIFEERAHLRTRVRERDAEVQNVMAQLQEYHTALQDQRAGYQDLREDCAKVDEVTMLNNILSRNLEDVQKQLEQERNIVASLEGALKEMASELENLRQAVGNNHSDMSEKIVASVKAYEQLLSSQDENFAESRKLLERLEFDCEDSDSPLFKALHSVLTTTGSNWADVKDDLSKLCREQEEVSQAYSEKFKKWHALKESLTQQIGIQVAQVKEQISIIHRLERDKASLVSEIEKQRELNACLVETKGQEMATMQSKLADVTHNYELAESNRREFVVRVSLLESTVNTLQSKLDTERQEAESERKSLKESSEKYRREVDMLKSKEQDGKGKLLDIAELQRQIQQAKLVEVSLRDSLSEEIQRREGITRSVENLEEQLVTKDEQLSAAASGWADTSMKQSRQDAELIAVRAELQLKSDQIQSQAANIQIQRAQISSLEVELEDRTRILKGLRGDLFASSHNVEVLTEEIRVHKNTLDESKQIREGLQRSFEEQLKKFKVLEQSLEDVKSEAEMLQHAGRRKDGAIGDLEKQLDLAKGVISRKDIEISTLGDKMQQLRQEAIALNDALERLNGQRGNDKSHADDSAGLSNTATQLQEAKATRSRPSETPMAKPAAGNDRVDTSIILVHSTNSQERLTRTNLHNVDSLVLESQEKCPVVENLDFSVVPATQDRPGGSPQVTRAVRISNQEAMSDLIPATQEKETAAPQRKGVVQDTAQTPGQASQNGPWELPDGSSPQASLQYNAAKHRQRSNLDLETADRESKKRQYSSNRISGQDITATNEPKLKKDKTEETTRAKRKIGYAGTTTGSQANRKSKKSKK